MAWTVVARFMDLEEGKGVAVTLGDKQIALFRQASEVFAIDAVCPHRGGPLVEGHMDGGELSCPWHAWSFDLKTGRCSVSPEINQPVFPVKVENGDVLLDA